MLAQILENSSSVYFPAKKKDPTVSVWKKTSQDTRNIGWDKETSRNSCKA